MTQRIVAYICFAFLFFVMGHPFALVAAVAIVTYSNPIAKIGEAKLRNVAIFVEKLIAKLPSKPVLKEFPIGVISIE